MSFKYLFANGCSFVYGENAGEYLGLGKEYNTELRFSKLLADKLNAEEINYGKNGESNHYITRTTFDWIEANQDKVKDTLFVIGTTEPLRLEFWLDFEKRYQAVSMRWIAGCVDNVKNLEEEQLQQSLKNTIPRIFGDDSLNPDEGLEWYRKYLKYFYSYEEEENVTERLYKQLNSHIKSFGGTLILFHSIYDSIKDKSQFNFFNFPGENNFWKGYNRFKQDNGENWKTSCTHPSHLSHAWFAEALHEYIIENRLSNGS